MEKFGSGLQVLINLLTFAGLVAGGIFSFASLSGDVRVLTERVQTRFEYVNAEIKELKEDVRTVLERPRNPNPYLPAK